MINKLKLKEFDILFMNRTHFTVSKKCSIEKGIKNVFGCNICFEIPDSKIVCLAYLKMNSTDNFGTLVVFFISLGLKLAQFTKWNSPWTISIYFQKMPPWLIYRFTPTAFVFRWQVRVIRKRNIWIKLNTNC